MVGYSLSGRPPSRLLCYRLVSDDTACIMSVLDTKPDNPKDEAKHFLSGQEVPQLFEVSEGTSEPRPVGERGRQAGRGEGERDRQGRGEN